MSVVHGSHSTHCEPNYTTLNLRSGVVLQGTQLMEYGHTHHTIIWFSLISNLPSNDADKGSNESIIQG